MLYHHSAQDYEMETQGHQWKG